MAFHHESYISQDLLPPMDSTGPTTRSKVFDEDLIDTIKW